MWFELLAGVHQQANIHTGQVETFEAKIIRDDAGKPIKRTQPVIESNRDLVALFGPDKFRRVDQIRGAETRSAGTEGEDKATGPVSPSGEAAGAKTALLDEEEEEEEEAPVTPRPNVRRRKGADVTGKFALAKALDMKVWLYKGRYTVVDATGDVLNDKPLVSPSQVRTFMTRYQEG